MVTERMIFERLADAEKAIKKYLQDYHPAGYGTAYKISPKQHGILYIIKVQEDS